MDIQALKQILQENGIVGAGGAGFPTYAKLDQRAEVILMNCAECEPLLKLHRQLLEQRAKEILAGQVCFEWNEGGHFHDIEGRFAKALMYLRIGTRVV